MENPHIVLRLLDGGLVELTLARAKVKLTTPDAFAKGALLREVDTILATETNCYVQFGTTGSGIAYKNELGETDWRRESPK